MIIFEIRVVFEEVLYLKCTDQWIGSYMLAGDGGKGLLVASEDSKTIDLRSRKNKRSRCTMHSCSID